MFNNIYILNYNNYYNRIIKTEGDKVTDYINNVDVVGSFSGVNFNPNDGIEAEVTLNTSGGGDYLLVAEGNNIVSRWFIIEQIRIRGEQYKFLLHRDVIADYKNIIINAPCFIEKATVSNNDPAIFFNEDMTFNQIKTKEILLENNLKTPWVVAYLSRSHTDPETTETAYNYFSGSFKREGFTVYDRIYDRIEDYPLWNLTTDKTGGLGALIATNLTFGTRYIYLPQRYDIYNSFVYKDGSSYISVTTDADIGDYIGLIESNTIVKYPYSNAVAAFNALSNIYNTYNTVDEFGLKFNSVTNSYDYDSYLIMLGESNKIIKGGDKYYQVSVTLKNKAPTGSLYGVDGAMLLNPALQLTQKSRELLVTPYFTLTDEASDTQQTVSIGNGTYNQYAEITIVEVPAVSDEVTYSFDYASGTVTDDAEYEIIATPYYNTEFDLGNGEIFYHSGAYGLQWFLSLANKYYSSGYCYDLQLVPYCSIDNDFVEDQELAGRTIYCVENDINRAIAFKLPKASFSLINTTLTLDLNPNIKVGNLTEVYRITSPNGVGNFEFSPYKNKGFFGYEVDCTLRPISPYIKVNPIFNPNGLYGGDYNDFRGLICGGDFSLSITSNAWQTYANNNKYFQDIFDRQISTLETQNTWQTVADSLNAVAGTVQSAASGAMLGSYAPGVGTMAGGIAGASVGLLAGLGDIGVNRLLRDEAIDYTKDQFKYQMQTIKARPDTLTRSTSYNINNKYFPYIEVFSCTDIEKEALINKMKYNGMTVMRIATIEDFILNEPSYIKGKIIRLEGIDEDYHVATEISKELNMGVFI